MSLKLIGLTLILCIVSLPAKANEKIKKCLDNNPKINYTILSAFRDKSVTLNVNSNRPLEYYQIGQKIDNSIPEHQNTSYNVSLIIINKLDQCQHIQITDLFGYEPYVPDPAAVDMEIKDIEWRSQKRVQQDPLVPNEIPEVPVTPEELGHGCEPWTKTMAKARAQKGLSLDGCTVRQKRLRLIWDRKSS